MDWNLMFRPHSWSDVVGQNHIKPIIQQSLFSSNFPKFSLFTGPSGTGKSSIAELCAMTLTCSNGQGEPCGECDNCKRFLEGKSLAVKKFNMAKMLGKADVVSVLNDIFQFESIVGRTVYILEEIHALRDIDQAPFLEELTKIPDDVYIIACTTAPYKVLNEIRNRAIIFNCEIPTNAQCRTFIKRICKSAGIVTPPDDTLRTLVDMCENTPRKIVATLQLFATSGELTSEALYDFFGVADKKIYIDWLERLQNTYTFFEYSEWLENLLDSKYSAVKMVKGLDNFMTDVLLERSRKNKFKLFEDGKRLEEICERLGESGILRLSELLIKRDYHSVKSESSAIYFLISIKLEMNPAVNGGNASNATMTKLDSNELARKKVNEQASSSNADGLKKINSADLKSTGTLFFIDDDEE